MTPRDSSEVSLLLIAREWGRIGIIGFGGPPAHISLLRERLVDRNQWISSDEFEDAIAAVNLLPGPASTQLAIFLAWRLRQTRGALIGGLCFITPGLAIILALSTLFLSGHPPTWVEGLASGAGAAVPAVALKATLDLMPQSWKRARLARARQIRWIIYALSSALCAATIGQLLALAIMACGLCEVIAEQRATPRSTLLSLNPALLLGVAAAAGVGPLAWVALKVGALSYGGGFVIIPLMQHDAVTTYHWMSQGQFLNVVALGQVTPGPVVQTVAAVGYAAAGIGGGLLAALIAFGPSFLFVLIGGRYFLRLKNNDRLQAFLTGASAASIGAITGSAIPLGLSLTHLWQIGVLALAGLWLLAFKRNLVVSLILAGALGALASVAGWPVH